MSSGLRFALAVGLLLVVLTGSGFAAYQLWFEPSPELLQAEGLGELVPGETRILEKLSFPEGVTFQLVTYRATEVLCFDVTAETDAGPSGATGGCDDDWDQAANLGDSEIVKTSSGGLNVLGRVFTTAMGFAGKDVREIRFSYNDGTSQVRPVHTDLRVWFAVGSPTRGISGWEPAS